MNQLNQLIFERALRGEGAYATAVKNGFVGTEQDWLNSLKGQDGSTGADGQSAYQLWIDEGNTGSVDDFLASLKGQDGVIGIDGKSAYQFWIDEGNTGNIGDFLASLKGDKGSDGQNGMDGKDGIDGNMNEHPLQRLVKATLKGTAQSSIQIPAGEMFYLNDTTVNGNWGGSSETALINPVDGNNAMTLQSGCLADCHIYIELVPSSPWSTQDPHVQLMIWQSGVAHIANADYYRDYARDRIVVQFSGIIVTPMVEIALVNNTQTDLQAITHYFALVERTKNGAATVA